MYIVRENEKDFFASFEGPFVSALFGPRRVGKTTLVEHYIAMHPKRIWVPFNMDERRDKQRIAEGELLSMIEKSSLQKIGMEKIWVVIDEAQKCPELFDQIKLLYDRFKGKDKIKFILTGSAHLNLHNLAAETLAGRIDLLKLRDFNLRETVKLQSKQLISIPSAFHLIFNLSDIEAVQENYLSLRPFQDLLSSALEQQLVFGGLPEVLQIESENMRFKYLSNYLQTYLENDIREITTISDLNLYENLMRVMAEQTGSIRDDQKVVNALHCSNSTMQKYQGYLMATWQYMEIESYITNTLKRLVKSPKGYLRNNGLISYFTGIKDLSLLEQTGLIGHRFENWFLNELSSFLDPIAGYHKTYFWRTHGGQEVDFVVQLGQKVIPFEITYSIQALPKKIRNLKAFMEENPKVQFAIYVYRGEMKFDKENKILFLPFWMI